MAVTAPAARRASAIPAAPSAGYSSTASQSGASSHDYDAIAAKLSDPNSDDKSKLAIAMEMKDSADLYQRDVDPTRFFTIVLPCFIEILGNGKPTLASGTTENRLRNHLLQILQRLPHTEALRAQTKDLMPLLLKLLRTENEENALLALKLITDYHRSFGRPLSTVTVPGEPAPATGIIVNPVEASVPEFLELVAELFKGMNTVVEEFFATTGTPGPETNVASPANVGGLTIEEAAGMVTAGSGASMTLPLGMKSFKLLQDCPAAVVLMLQTYRSIAEKAIVVFVPLVFNFLSLQAPPQARMHQIMKEQNKNFVGVSPDILKAKRPAYTEFLIAQSKTMSFLAYILRASPASLSAHKTILPGIAVRLLKDCPPEACALRKDLLVATRHILQSELRITFLGQIDTMLDNDVLVGNGLTAHETLRPLAFSMLADLVHHVRADLTLAQLSRVVHIYSANIHDSTLAPSIQTMCSKLLLNLIDPISNKEPIEAGKVLRRIMTAFVSKLEGMAEIRDDWAKWSKPRDSIVATLAALAARDARVKKEAEEEANNPEPKIVEMEVEVTGEDKTMEDGTTVVELPKPAATTTTPKVPEVKVPAELDEVDIERAKPIARAIAMVEPGPDPVKDARFLYRNLLFGYKTIANTLGRVNGSAPDAEMTCRFFEAAVKCMVLFDVNRDGGREQKEVMEVFSTALVQTDLIVFQEVFETRIEFLVTELLRNHDLLVIPQSLLANEHVCSPFVSILWRFLISRLSKLGEDNAEYNYIFLRLFKMAFMAVTIFPEKNEATLLPHLSNLIMKSLKLASQAAEPTNYYLLLRALFRSIGGGRFEILYKEVLPLLQVLLEQLNALLKAADKSKRDLFAELILTVPVRLSVLLPYLSYLMKPLVHALHAGPELVTQGLRTLELCVDNLTQEFLNPLMAPVIDEVMAGLWKLLRPLPFNHQHSHTTMRILGKIGGRNRKLFNPPKLEWKPVGEESLLNIRFEGKDATIRIGPIVDLALTTIRRRDVHYRRTAYSFFKYAVALFLKNGLPAGEPEGTFGNILRGLFDATRVEEFSVDANEYILNLARYIFSLELGKPLPDDATSHKEVLPLCSALIDGIIENLSAAENDDLAKAADQTQKIVEDLLATVNPSAEIKPDPPLILLHQMATRLGSLCYDQSWQRKIGAAVGLSILTSRVNLGVRWILDHEIELTRALLFSLKDMPSEAALNTQQISDTLLHILKVCNAPGARDDTPAEKTKLDYLVGLLLVELCSQVACVRETVKTALQIISDSTGTPLTQMLLPVRDRLLVPIFTKPLRALAFTMQIGHIDAVTYCITLNPPLIDFDDQLSRLLHEALGIADAEDTALIGSKTTAKTTAPLTQLRVVCVQLLSAAMASPEFMPPKQQVTRMKTLSVYFKLLYAKAPEVVEASYQSLKAVMQTQGKLPKDLLQNGLKPVLMNLADHKKLSVASLDGLARLLELLTNYFKVEIGQKLLDHFRNLAIPADIIRASTKQPSENGELEIIAAIVNIFHLLPHPAAEIFLDDIVKQVVDVERYLKKVQSSIFTTPLTRYLRIYPAQTTTYFFARLDDERFVSTFRSVIGSEHGGEIRDHITSMAKDLFEPCFVATGDLGYHAALIIKELIKVDPEWIVKSPEVLSQLISRWVSDIRRTRLEQDGDVHFEQLKEDALILDIFITYLRQAENIDLLFHVVDTYTFFNSADRTALSRFINQHVALSTNVSFKRQILERFIDIYENTAVSPAHKTAALRVLVNPILLVSFSRGPREAALVDPAFVSKVHSKIWQPLLSLPIDPTTTSFADESLKTEITHMTTLLLRYCPDLVSDYKKEAIKFGYINIKTEDITVTQASYVLLATFIDKFETPAKYVLPVYVSLLKAHQNEAKLLVREALDILTPVLEKRLITPAGDSGVPSWSKWTRKVLTEEGSAIGQLVNIFQLLARHPDLFFPTRDLFLGHIVSSLSKLTSSVTVTADTRILTLDLVELILKWERRRIELRKLEDAKMEIDVAGAAASEGGEVDKSPKRPAKPDRAPSVAASSASQAHGLNYAVPSQLRDQVINNLLRFLTNSPEALPRSIIVSRALALLKELIGPTIWSEVNVKLVFFQRTFSVAEVTEANINTLCNSAEVLNVVVRYKTDGWVLANYGILHKLVEKGHTSTEVRLHVAQRPLLDRMFEVLPQAIASGAAETDPEIKAFVDWATALIEDGLRTFANVPSSISVLKSWAQTSPERIDGFIGVLIRAFSTWAKEHNTSTTPVATTDPQLKLLVASLELLTSRVSFLGDQRRWFLSAIIQLVEKSSNIELCKFLLTMTRRWVTDKEESYPTAKEKAGVLITMMKFESRNNEPLLKDYLNLILDIYTDKNHARSELTVKLEPAFLLGCKNRDPEIRSKFLAAFDQSLAKGLFSRLHYVLGVQSWETLGDTYWIYQALDLVLGAVDTEDRLFQSSSSELTAAPSAFVTQLEAYTTGDLLGSARKLLYADPQVAHALWVSTFTATWTCLSRREQLDLTRFVIGLLTKEYHLRSVDRRPSVIHTLLAAVLACSPSPSLPPHLVRYLSKTFNAWHIGMELLQEALENPREEESIRESTLDALAETYSELSEDDLLYGLWRRRAGYNETNAAISWEQIGQWAQAQVLYESAQIAGRSGVLPFSESEMALWEDHWIITSQKLQQWDVLADLAKNEGNKELLLECAWRLSDWSTERELIEQSIEGMSPVATPRRRIFEAYMALIKSQSAKPGEDRRKEFNRLVDEGIQLSLRKWYYLPEIVSQAHVPLLQVFQQFVELQEAQLIFSSLTGTTVQNLDARSAELKNVLSTWRDRLPNLWDDINVWSDLVAWRQHVFAAINKTYLPLIPTGGNAGASQNSNSFAYRGYHETAWTINKFAHVARKHHLNDVCITSLTKIYTLPNIEIQEAFLKLREQAKCHYQNSSELASGLEVINNTNLMYFNAGQKAEFFTLKGMFLAKLGLHDEANQTFNLAVSMDMGFPKAWAEWGEYHDRMYKENPHDLNIAANAVSCYLQAAGLYKSSKVRKLLVRILWLLSLDDASGTVSKAFDGYKGDVPTWYWITFIPQLLLALSHREARYARVILMKIAKAFPQSLFFQLRTIREDQSVAKRIHLQNAARLAATRAAAMSPQTVDPLGAPLVTSNDPLAQQQQQQQQLLIQQQQQLLLLQQQQSGMNGMLPGTNPNGHRHPWEHIDEIHAILKTAFPLLALSMEMIVDQVSTRFKPLPDEDIYRLISALLADGIQQYVGRATHSADDGLLAPITVSNVARFAENLHPQSTKAHFEKDFLTSKPTLRDYVQRLQVWRDRYEALLNKKPKRCPLESSSHWLVEFQYQKFDEIEVPGQYLRHDDNNANYVRISHFSNKFDVTRSNGVFFRRLTIIGHDGSSHRFAIQIPSSRSSRREERIMQLFRMLNCPLTTRKESRKRNLLFNIPIAIPLAPGVRLIENDESIISLQDIFGQYCKTVGMSKEDPILAHTERVRALHRAVPALSRAELWNGRLEIAEEIAYKMAPDDILKKYMIKSMASPSDLWQIRKQMTLQMAAFIFMTYVMSMGARMPSRILISRSTGKIHTSDMLPSLLPNKPEFVNNESVPFRFTPNFQKFITPIGTEGLLTSSLMAIARCLTESEFDLEHRLSIFIREEVLVWSQTSKEPRSGLRELVLSNVDAVVRRAKVVSCKLEREKPPSATTPVNQSILELLLQATSLPNLSKMDPTFAPWL